MTTRSSGLTDASGTICGAVCLAVLIAVNCIFYRGIIRKFMQHRKK